MIVVRLLVPSGLLRLILPAHPHTRLQKVQDQSQGGRGDVELDTCMRHVCVPAAHVLGIVTVMPVGSLPLFCIVTPNQCRPHVQDFFFFWVLIVTTMGDNNNDNRKIPPFPRGSDPDHGQGRDDMTPHNLNSPHHFGCRDALYVFITSTIVTDRKIKVGDMRTYFRCQRAKGRQALPEVA